jgi:hypothetical protein
MNRSELNAVVKTRVRKSERDAFKAKAAATGQSIASRLAWLLRQDLRSG